MSILKEIHEQPEWVRAALFGLSCITLLSMAGYLWYSSFERDAYVALNPEEGAARYDRVALARPDPLEEIRKGLDGAMASIGTLIGFDRSKGFDITPWNEDNQGRAYLLPLSE